MSVVEAMMKIRKMVKIYKIVSSGFFSCIRYLLDVTVKKLDTALSVAGATLKRAFPGASVVKNPPAMEEMRVQSLGQEDPLEKEMATHSEISCTEEPGGVQSMGSQRVGYNSVTEHTPWNEPKRWEGPEVNSCQLTTQLGNQFFLKGKIKRHNVCHYPNVSLKSANLLILAWYK